MVDTKEGQVVTNDTSPAHSRQITQYKELDTNNVSIRSVKTLLAQNINIHSVTAADDSTST